MIEHKTKERAHYDEKDKKDILDENMQAKI